MSTNYSALKTSAQLKDLGYNLLAYSSNGAFEVTSFIAKIKGKKVYGSFAYDLNKYVTVAA